MLTECIPEIDIHIHWNRTTNTVSQIEEIAVVAGMAEANCGFPLHVPSAKLSHVTPTKWGSDTVPIHACSFNFGVSMTTFRAFR